MPTRPAPATATAPASTPTDSRPRSASRPASATTPALACRRAGSMATSTFTTTATPPPISTPGASAPSSGTISPVSICPAKPSTAGTMSIRGGPCCWAASPPRASTPTAGPLAEAGAVLHSGQFSIEPFVSYRHASTSQTLNTDRTGRCARGGAAGLRHRPGRDRHPPRQSAIRRRRSGPGAGQLRTRVRRRQAALDNDLPGLPTFRVVAPGSAETSSPAPPASRARSATASRCSWAAAAAGATTTPIITSTAASGSASDETRFIRPGRLKLRL